MPGPGKATRPFREGRARLPRTHEEANLPPSTQRGWESRLTPRGTLTSDPASTEAGVHTALTQLQPFTGRGQRLGGEAGTAEVTQLAGRAVSGPSVRCKCNFQERTRFLQSRVFPGFDRPPQVSRWPFYKLLLVRPTSWDVGACVNSPTRVRPTPVFSNLLFPWASTHR